MEGGASVALSAGERHAKLRLIRAAIIAGVYCFTLMRVELHSKQSLGYRAGTRMTAPSGRPLPDAHGAVTSGRMSRPALSTLRSAFALAWPASVAAMVTPLLGLVDSAVLARAAGSAEIAGVALGAAIFSLLYWPFAFLRMGTAGLVAQADGRGDETALRAHLVQGVIIGLVCGLVLILVRPLVIALGIPLMADDAISATAVSSAETYVSIRLLSAPFALAFYAGVGWLTGQGRTGLMMAAAFTATILNGVLDVWLVLGLDLGVRGIAIGTALAEAASALLVGGAILVTLLRRGGIGAHWARQKLSENWRGIVSLNTNIFVRTFLLALVFVWFIRAGTPFGDRVLAANQILVQLLLVTGLVLDGPAIAAESLVGQALGRDGDRRAAFVAATLAVGRLTAGAAIVLTILLFVAATPILGTIVPAESAADLRETVERYYPYAALSPIVVAFPFYLDGVFIGATEGKTLRNAMIVSVAVFGAALYGLRPLIGNDGVWVAFGAFMLARAGTLSLSWHRVLPPAQGDPEQERGLARFSS